MAESAQGREISERFGAIERRLMELESGLRRTSTRLSLAEIFLGGKALTIQPIGPAFTAAGGMAWVFELPGLLDRASTMQEPNRSSLVVCENGKPLGPGNALHDDVRNKGFGMYSHWDYYLLFSTSDNSDPSKNGRIYEIVIPDE